MVSLSLPRMAPPGPAPDAARSGSVSSNAVFLAFAPAIFIILWSSGWIVAKYVAPHADPLTFLAVRFAVAAGVLLPIVLIAGERWPRSLLFLVHVLVSGALIHAFYLGSVWWVIRHGLPSGISGLIAALQPIMTAILALLVIGERMGPRGWAGVLIGFLGVVVVLSPRLGAGAGDALPLIAVNGLGILSLTLGSFYQKRFLAGAGLVTTTLMQYVGATVVILPLAAWLEPMQIDWRFETAAGLAWSVLVLSIVSILLMLFMLNRGAVSRVAALSYLVPPLVAVQAWAMFGETLLPIQIAGMAMAAGGVYLVTARSPA